MRAALKRDSSMIRLAVAGVFLLSLLEAGVGLYALLR
jgi:hypothetical protein